MEGVLKVLIIGGTIALGMFFAYLSQRSKERADLARHGGGDGPSREDFDALQQQVGELAERVDFAERMLAQRREPERLAEPRQEGRS